jgi:hypothetical protein
MNSLSSVRSRIARLAKSGTPAFEAVLSQRTWLALQAEHLGCPPGPAGRTLNGIDVLGIRIRLVKNARGVGLKYASGLDLDLET